MSSIPLFKALFRQKATNKTKTLPKAGKTVLQRLFSIYFPRKQQPAKSRFSQNQQINQYVNTFLLRVLWEKTTSKTKILPKTNGAQIECATRHTNRIFCFFERFSSLYTSNPQIENCFSKTMKNYFSKAFHRYLQRTGIEYVFKDFRYTVNPYLKKPD